MYNIFFDDERFPKDVKWVELPDIQWTIVRSYNEFVEIIRDRGIPDFISFDHDLVDDHYKRYFRARETGFFDYRNLAVKTGFCAASWLVYYCNLSESPLPGYKVHSKNEFGAENIRRLFENAKKDLDKFSKPKQDSKRNEQTAS